MFAKIFGQIFDSSIADNPDVRHGFMDLLVLADSDGVVDMTPEAISRRTNVPLEKVLTYLGELSKPDPRSRSRSEGGSRIQLIDPDRAWGWSIVNYAHYRDIKDEQARRTYFRDKQRERRQKQGASVKHCPIQLKKVTHAEAEAEAEAKGEGYARARENEASPQGKTESNVPSLQEAIDGCSVSGVAGDFAKMVYEDWSGRDGRDAAGVPVEWLGYVTRRWNRERKEWMNGTHRNNKKDGKPGGVGADRNEGTFNAGKASQYRNVGKVV